MVNEKYIVALGCHTPPYMKKIKSNSKKWKKIWNYFGTKDDQVLYLYKNILLRNYFHCFLGKKKTKSKRPMSMYYSLYIRHNFVFFFPKKLGNHFFPKHFFTSTILDRHWFPGRFNFLLNFLSYYNFLGLWKCVAPESHKSALII